MLKFRESMIFNSLLLIVLYLISWVLLYNINFTYSSYLFIGIWIGYIIYLVKYVMVSSRVNLRSRFNNSTLAYAVVIGLLQILVYVGFGIIYGFGYSPYGHSGYSIFFNLIFFLTPLFAREMYRFITLVGRSNKDVIKKIILTSTFLGLISIPLPSYNIFSSGMYSHLYLFVVSVIIPSIAYNLVGSYLIVYGGIFSSFIYLAMLRMFELFSPILPNIDWTLTILIGVLVPIFSIIMLESLYPYNIKKRWGIVGDIHFLRIDKRDKGLLFSLSAILLLLWFINGFFGAHPTVIVSDSMAPTLNRGDVVIVKEYPSKNINVGDVIEYVNVEGLRIVHRVVDREMQGNVNTYITKGDANIMNDGVIYPFQVQGKIIFSIPYVGWFSIYAKNSVLALYTYVIEYPFYVSLPLLFLSAFIIGRKIMNRKDSFLGELNG